MAQGGTTGETVGRAIPAPRQGWAGCATLPAAPKNPQGDPMKPTPFEPPRRTLMGPGPSDVHPRVLAAMSRPTLGHLDPAFIGFMDEVKELLQYAFRTSNTLTLPVSGPGS